ncbi:hypothetical protein C7M18_02083 [Bacillus velezensis]|nr:hypothetical protein C7M18_02083 [Bacillus velezensis]
MQINSKNPCYIKGGYLISSELLMHSSKKDLIS